MVSNTLLITNSSICKISDGAQKQFQRIKKSLLPKTRKEGFLYFARQCSPALTSFFLLRDYIFKFLVFFNFIFELCRRRCRLQGLPLRKPKPYCNRPRLYVSDNLPQRQIRLLSARRNRSKANKSTRLRNCRHRRRDQRCALRTSLKNALRRS